MLSLADAMMICYDAIITDGDTESHCGTYYALVRLTECHCPCIIAYSSAVLPTVDEHDAVRP